MCWAAGPRRCGSSAGALPRPGQARPDSGRPQSPSARPPPPPPAVARQPGAAGRAGRHFRRGPCAPSPPARHRQDGGARVAAGGVRVSAGGGGAWGPQRGPGTRAEGRAGRSEAAEGLTRSGCCARPAGPPRAEPGPGCPQSRGFGAAGRAGGCSRPRGAGPGCRAPPGRFPAALRCGPGPFGAAPGAALGPPPARPFPPGRPRVTSV